MGKVTVELDWEAVDNIVLQELKGSIDCLKDQLARVQSSGKGNVFDMVYEVDVAMITKHIEACELIYKYYGGL
jgi:hypothetical protein